MQNLGGLSTDSQTQWLGAAHSFIHLVTKVLACCQVGNIDLPVGWVEAVPACKYLHGMLMIIMARDDVRRCRMQHLQSCAAPV